MRVAGVEPAWIEDVMGYFLGKTIVLPLNYTRMLPAGLARLIIISIHTYLDVRFDFIN